MKMTPSERELLGRMLALCFVLLVIATAIHFGVPTELIVPVFNVVRK